MWFTTKPEAPSCVAPSFWQEPTAPKLDADLYVPALVKDMLGSKNWMVQIGTAGGTLTSFRSKQARHDIDIKRDY